MARSEEGNVTWDERKDRLNQRKHGISFEEAGSIFGDLFEITIDDPDHSASEDRFISIGESFKRRLLVVSYTERGNDIRIISARKPTRNEQRKYEET